MLLNQDFDSENDFTRIQITINPSLLYYNTHVHMQYTKLNEM